MNWKSDPSMPRLPWMLIYNKDSCKSVPKMQLQALHAPTYLEYLCNLSINSEVARYRMTQIACSLNKKNVNEILPELLVNEVWFGIVDLSYGNSEEIKELLSTIREIVNEYMDSIGRCIPFTIGLEMSNLRMRTGRLEDRSVDYIKLKKNQTIYITIDTNYKCHCNENYIYVDNAEILNMLVLDDEFYINYGEVTVKVIEKGGHQRVKGIITTGGKLYDHSLVHLPNVPNEHRHVVQEQFINFAVEQEVELIIIPKVQQSCTISNVKRQLPKESQKVLIFARIEDELGVENIENILDEADGIVIARGELGISIPMEKLFIIQKSITALCNKMGKSVMVSTHILSSMSRDRQPYRSETMDVSNAILDGVDIIHLNEDVMLGENPMRCIKFLIDNCKEAEAAMYQPRIYQDLTLLCLISKDLSNTMAITAVDFSLRNKANAIIVLTTSGRTAKLISKYKPRCPILATTRYGHIARKLNMYRGIKPVYYIEPIPANQELGVTERVEYAVAYGKSSEFIRQGDVVVLVCGWKKGGDVTDTLRILHVP